MEKHSTPRQRVEFGLDTIPPDRLVTVPLRDLMFVHQTLAEFVQFFHQCTHYPDLHAVQQFLGTRGSGDAMDVLLESVHKRMHDMLPPDMHEAFAEGERFEHPLPPRYYDSTAEPGPDPHDGLSFKRMSEYRYQFFRGDKLLGVVHHTEDDQPFHIGSFVPAADFEEVRPLFELEVAELHKPDKKNGRWSEAWGKVSAPGLRLVSERTGQLKWGGDQLLLIHIDGVKVWWRG